MGFGSKYKEDRIYMYTIGSWQQDLILEVGHDIKVCGGYIQLGINVSQAEMEDEAIEDNIIEERRAISILNSILCDKQVSKEEKGKYIISL